VRGEVKSAFVTHKRVAGRYDGWGWQFSLRRNGKAVDEDLLFLVCYEDVGKPLATFIIPGDALDSRLSKIDITARDPRRYRGRWSIYCNDWSGVERVVNRAPMHKHSLFRAVEDEAIPF